VIYVLDASAIIAYIRGEQGGEVVLSALLDQESACFVHALNLCEVYYDFHRALGELDADRILEELDAAGVARRDDISRSFCRAAAALKSEFRRVSLADCFALTLARDLSARLVTADHHELDALVATGRFDVGFIR
jgi:PIN domain nuclease of toxin-antitoxin system